MVAFNKTDDFAEQIGLSVHNLNTDLIKVALLDTAPIASNSLFGDVSANEVSTTGGYVAGGYDVTNVWDESPTATGRMVCTDVTITASGAAIDQFRYVMFYNDTPSSPLNPNIGWYDHGSNVDLADGESFKVDFAATTLTIT